MFVKQEVAMKKAAIVMGSDSDLGKVRSAALTLKELGITEVTDEKLMAVATAACAENDTLHNMPFEVTPESVCAAMKAADAYGRYYLGE